MSLLMMSTKFMMVNISTFEATKVNIEATSLVRHDVAATTVENFENLVIDLNVGSSEDFSDGEELEEDDEEQDEELEENSDA